MSDVIKTLTEAFALANGAVELANNIIEATKGKSKKSDKDDARIGSSGDYARIGSSGDYAQIGSSGDYARIVSSGYGAQIGSSGYGARIGSSGYGAQIGSSGNDAQIGSSGDYAQIGSSGYGAQIGSSGYGARIGSSGYGAQIGSSGDDAQIGSSGYGAQIDSTGKKSVVAAIGINSVAKAEKGSWLTLAEYRKNSEGRYKVYHVKTEYVDDDKIKSDTWYCLYNKEFHQYMKFDGIGCAVISQKGNVYKVHNINSDKESYVVTDGEYFSHGDTIKQAKEDLIYKISNRDTSQYKDLTLDSVVTKTEAIKMYRVITGACEAGTKHFVSGLAKTKAKYKVSELIELTKGQYGNETFKNFFEEQDDE